MNENRNVRKEREVRRETVAKEGGRYIIFYSFGEARSRDSDGSSNGKSPGETERRERPSER